MAFPEHDRLKPSRLGLILALAVSLLHKQGAPGAAERADLGPRNGPAPRPSAEAGATAPEIVVESFDHHIDTEQFWTIVLGSGYRGPLEAMGPEAAARVRDEVMGRLRADAVRVLSSEVMYSRARK